MHGNN